MQFIDGIFQKCFSAGMLVSQAFAVVLFVSILLLTLFVMGQSALHLLG